MGLTFKLENIFAGFCFLKSGNKPTKKTELNIVLIHCWGVWVLKNLLGKQIEIVM
jgi:hypothetical protein